MRRFLYRLAALLGGINAVSRGPGAVTRRLARKVVTKESFKLINSIFKKGR